MERPFLRAFCADGRGAMRLRQGFIGATFELRMVVLDWVVTVNTNYNVIFLVVYNPNVC